MNYLAELRKGANLTQQELAKRAEVGKSTIAKIERAQIQPHPDTLKKIARALNVTDRKLAARLARDVALGGDQVATLIPGDPAEHTSSDEMQRREIAIGELGRGLNGDTAEALAFVALVNLFYERLSDCWLRPEAYRGYVSAARQMLEHAEHIGRALRAEHEANSITNGELDIYDEERQLRLAITAYNRWQLCHREALQSWAGDAFKPWWQNDLEDSYENWRRVLDSKLELSVAAGQYSKLSQEA